ncbi:transglycosylase SLT domain-containing protein [Neobacillus drentensis]|uniref:transglycosylase SLT domain-containing protein n=1 Tax=Neobacillus drentensis TaxID=220684 RepID=UPI002FFE9F3B
MIKKMVSLVAVGIAIGCFAGEKGFAATNPPQQEINRMLTEEAFEKGIPPEIVKAVAVQESGWRQFDEKGEPLNINGGIGIMQITNAPGYDQDQLKTNIEYNIKAGVEILNQKFSNFDAILPKLNDMDRDVLENWYFALLAYNGKKQVNSPTMQDDGSINTGAYQEKVYGKVDYYNNFMGVSPLPFPFKKEDFTYTGHPNFLLQFNKMEYVVPDHLLHVTKHKFEKDDIVLSAEGAYFRPVPSSSVKEIRFLPKTEREAITILDP